MSLTIPEVLRTESATQKDVYLFIFMGGDGRVCLKVSIKCAKFARQLGHGLWHLHKETRQGWIQLDISFKRLIAMVSCS